MDGGFCINNVIRRFRMRRMDGGVYMINKIRIFLIIFFILFFFLFKVVYTDSGNFFYLKSNRNFSYLYPY